MAKATVRIHGVLTWFDEPVETLTDCVSSVAPFLDRLVAVDGRWSLYQHRRFKSAKRQVDAIRRAARDIDLDVYVPDEPWETQVIKRTFGLREAAEGADWLLPFDADWTYAGDPAALRRCLYGETRESGLVKFYTPSYLDGPADDVFHPWHLNTRDRTQRLPLVYRALNNMRLERFHWSYVGDTDDGVTIGYWGPHSHQDALVFSLPEEAISIEHHCFDRDEPRVIRNVEYCARRQVVVSATGEEG